MSFGLSAQPSEPPPVDPYPTKVLWGSTTPTLTWECVMRGAGEEMGTGPAKAARWGGEGGAEAGEGLREGRGRRWGGVGEGPG